MSIVHADALESRDNAIEFGHTRNRTDAYSVHSAARNFVIAYEYLAITAAAQFLHQPLGVLRIAESACLNEERAGNGNV